MKREPLIESIISIFIFTLFFGFSVYIILDAAHFKKKRLEKEEKKFINTFAKNNNKKELEVFFDGNKVKSFPNPKKNLFATRYRDEGERAIYLDIYSFEVYQIVAKGYCSVRIGCDIDILENNPKAKDSLNDNEIMQNKEETGKDYKIIDNGSGKASKDYTIIENGKSGKVTLYFKGEYIKSFDRAMENTRLVPFETKNGFFFELREYLGYKIVSRLKCLETCIVETYF